jgi:hypothetical protein
VSRVHQPDKGGNNIAHHALPAFLNVIKESPCFTIETRKGRDSLLFSKTLISVLYYCAIYVALGFSKVKSLKVRKTKAKGTNRSRRNGYQSITIYIRVC